MMNWTPGQERKVSKMAQRRKRYDRQFKASAAKVVLSGEMTVKDLSGGTRHKGLDAEKMGL